MKASAPLDTRAGGALLPCLVEAAAPSPHDGHVCNSLLSGSNLKYSSVSRASAGLAENTTALPAGVPNWSRLFVPCSRTTCYSQVTNAPPSRHTPSHPSRSDRPSLYFVFLPGGQERTGAADEASSRIYFTTKRVHPPRKQSSKAAAALNWTAVNPAL